MKRYIARFILTARVMTLMLLAYCFLQAAAGTCETAPVAEPLPLPASDHRDGPLITNTPPMGFVPGQTLRVTVAHTGQNVGQDHPPPDVRVGVRIYDSSGRVIAQSTQVQIPRNEFRSFDFDRAALNLPGEPGTGRLQVRALLVMNVAEPYRFTTDPKATGLLVPSLELIDNSTGRTTAAGGCVSNLKQIGLAKHSVNP